MNKEYIKGAAAGIFSAACYGMNPLFGKPLYAEGLSTYSVLFYRFLFAGIMLTGVLLIRKQTFKLPARHFWHMVTAAVLLAVSCLCLFKSLSFKDMDGGIASTLLFIGPAFVALILFFVYKERISLFTAGCIVMATAGVAMLSCSGSGGNGGVQVNKFGVIYALFSALAYAIYMVMLRKSRLSELEPSTVTWYALVFGLPLFFIATGCGSGLHMLPNVKSLVCVTGLAFFPSLCAFLFVAEAIKRIGATKTAILSAFEPITALLIGILFFKESISAPMLAGVILLLGAVTLIVCKK